MMYQALYRRFRPKTFDEVLGQDHITTTLKNQITNNNIGHAYIFSGTRGTGKTSVAKIFARAVNCIDSKDGNPCNTCEMCKGILDESIMDVIEMDAASNNGVDDVRELREKVKYSPSKCRYKVYILDEAHMMSTQAFNAFLKTLEEPPSHLIFILATTEIEKLPATILSRCQRFDFKRLTNKDIVKRLNSICDEIGLKAEERALSLIARNSDGAMRDAISLLDQCVSFSEGTLTYEDALSILAIANEDLIFSLVAHVEEKDLDKALHLLDEIIQDGKDINQLIKDLIFHFRNLMIGKSSENPLDIIDADKETIERYVAQSKNMSTSFITNALQVLNDGENRAKWSTQPRIIVEMIIVKLIELKGELTLLERIERLEKIIESGNIKVSPRSEAVEKPKKDKQTKKTIKVPEAKDKEEEPEIIDDGSELSFDTVKDEWPKVLQNIKKQRIGTQALLMEGSLVNYENCILTIGYSDGFGIHKQAVSRKEHKEFVEKIVSKYFNKNIRIKFIMVNEDEKDLEKKSEEDEEKEMIKEAVDFFGKDLVNIKK